MVCITTKGKFARQYMKDVLKITNLELSNANANANAARAQTNLTLKATVIKVDEQKNETVIKLKTNYKRVLKYDNTSYELGSISLNHFFKDLRNLKINVETADGVSIGTGITKIKKNDDDTWEIKTKGKINNKNIKEDVDIILCRHPGCGTGVCGECAPWDCCFWTGNFRCCGL